MKIQSKFLPLALLTSVLVACETETLPGGDGDDAPSYECTSTTECAPGNECSGGSCVPIVACTVNEECAEGETCSSGVCRAMCTSNEDCGQLICDLVAGLCMPAPNPEPGSGGSDAGTGGGSGTGGGDGTGGTINPEEPTVETIDDLEDGNIQILPADGRIGFWYTYNEEQPRPLAAAPTSVDGSLVIHASGSHMGGVAADAAYGGIGVDLANANTDSLQPRSTSREAYDASAYDGIQFRIKGNGGTKSIRFEVVTSAVASGEEGGTCGSNCFDAHGRDVSLETEWKTVKVPFDSLVQEGWGGQTEFNPAQILGFAWEDLTTSAWEFWIDDLEFYEETVVIVDPPVIVPGECADSWGDESNGSITWYTFDQGTNNFGDVNCSYGITVGSSGVGDKVNNIYTGGGTYFGAIATADYNQAAACGACVEVTRDGGASVVVTVVDQCPVGSNPKCVKGHIDLSKAAFLQLGQESEGYVGQRAGLGSISWKYVDCPVPGNVTFRLKEPSNANWNQVIVENHTYPIKAVQVQVNGEWLNASREEYNFWLPPGGRFGGSPYQIRAIDINDGVVEGSVALTGGSQDAGEQFVCE